jgi:hypothetical protein
MKASIVTLTTVLALSSPLAMAQSGACHSRAAASLAPRAAMNSIPAGQSPYRHLARDTWSSRINGHGISRLGVTTNSGRMYNGA